MSDHQARGAIATSHHLATEAGAAALRAGGNAIDAALAAAATLCVVYPHNVALGGDLVALVHTPDGRTLFLNATGTAPAEQTLDALRQKHGEKLPLRGVDTITVPGGIRGWEALHELGATRSWADHLEAAIQYASDGVPVASSLAQGISDEREPMLQDPGCRDIFFRDSEPLAEGELLVQAQLAATLRTLAADGPGAFYQGELAEQWVSGLRSLGSKISQADLDAYEVEWGEPLEGAFAGHRVLTSPPNTSGFILLRALEAIQRGISDPLGAGAGEVAEALRAGNAVRATELADPRAGGLTGRELIDAPAPEYVACGSARPTGDTVGLSAVSSDGWAISFINSLFFRFGACILEPQTGVLFQNRGTAFSLDPSLHNAFEAGKRPLHTLMPVLVFEGDQLKWVPSTMGGAGQAQIHTHLLLRVLSGASPEQATAAPRWVVEEPQPSGEVSVMIEQDVAAEAKAAISASGFTLNEVPPLYEVLGHSNLIHLDGDRLVAASDPRSNGSAVVVTEG